MKGDWSFQITRKGGKNSVGEVRTIYVSREAPRGIRPGYPDGDKPSYNVISGVTHGNAGYNIYDDYGTGSGELFHSESEAMKYFQSELKKHDADDWVYEKKPNEKSSFSELADKTVSASKNKSSAAKQSQPSVGGASRGAGGTSTSGT